MLNDARRQLVESEHELQHALARKTQMTVEKDALELELATVKAGMSQVRRVKRTHVRRAVQGIKPAPHPCLLSFVFAKFTSQCARLLRRSRLPRRPTWRPTTRA